MRVILVLLGIAGLSSASECLYSLDLDIREAAGQAWLNSVRIYYESTDFMIVSGDASLASMRFARVLDADFGGPDAYALVHLSGPDGAVSAGFLGDVLMERSGIALVRLRHRCLDGLPLEGVILVQPLRPMRSEPSAPPDLSRGYDDYVSDMVAAVSEANFQGLIQGFQDYGTRYSSTDSYDTAALWVRDTIQGYGIDADLMPFSVGGSYDCVNVVAEKPGVVDSTKIFVICGHLDDTSTQPYSNAPGGDDNGSGSATVVEAARIMSGYDFKYTIRFICFGGEEQGLYGSAAYAAQAYAQGDDIEGVVNLDMLLYGPAGYENLWVPYNTASTGLALALDAICDTYVPALSVMTEYNPGITYSDHSSFWNQGYPAVLGIEQEVFSNPYYHQTTDLLSNYMMYFPFGTNCARGAIATVACLAEPVGPTGTGDSGPSLPGAFSLAMDGPNPAVHRLLLGVTCPCPARVDIRVLDITGRGGRSATLGHPGGTVPFQIALDGLPDGVFFATASRGDDYGSIRFVKTE